MKEWRILPRGRMGLGACSCGSFILSLIKCKWVTALHNRSGCFQSIGHWAPITSWLGATSPSITDHVFCNHKPSPQVLYATQVRGPSNSEPCCVAIRWTEAHNIYEPQLFRPECYLLHFMQLWEHNRLCWKYKRYEKEMVKTQI